MQICDGSHANWLALLRAFHQQWNEVVRYQIQSLAHTRKSPKALVANGSGSTP